MNDPVVALLGFVDQKKELLKKRREERRVIDSGYRRSAERFPRGPRWRVRHPL